MIAAEVSPDYFAVLSALPYLGRTFQPQDCAPGARRTALLTRGIWQRTLGGDRTAVGRTVLVNGAPAEIVGVMPDTLFAPGAPQIWVPQRPEGALRQNQRAHLFTVLARVRPDTPIEAAKREVETLAAQIDADSGAVDSGLATAADPLSLAPAAREAVWRIDRHLPVASIRTLSDSMSAAVAQRRFNLILVKTFSIAALALAAMGLYGTLASAVGQRTREIGVRMASGAAAADIARVVRTHGAVPVLAGLACGLAAAWAGSQAIRGLLFGVQGPDAFTFGAVSGLMLAVAAVVSLAPIRRAVSIDPAEVLRG